MKKSITTIALLFVCLSLSAQLAPGHEGGKFIITPSLSHNLSQVKPSSEAGLSVGIQAPGGSSLSVGYNFRYYLEGGIPDRTFHAGQLSTVVYPISGFRLGLTAQADLRRGEFQDEDVTIGADIICPCTGKVIGKEDDTRGSSVRNKTFGTVGLTYKIDNFRVEGALMFRDYAPNGSDTEKYPVSRNPYNYYPVKIKMAYELPLLKPRLP